MGDDQYVVLEYNQASGRPVVAFNGDVYDNAVDAMEDAEGQLRQTHGIGRRERYAVARLNDIEEAVLDDR